MSERYSLRTVRETLDAIFEEIDALNALSYHGSPGSDDGRPWMADITKEDAERLRDLFADAAANLEAMS